jgi:glycosyltransferase involved in cell wall biosynthesis
MLTANFKNKRVLFFHADMYRPGGSERLMIEEIKYCESLGADTDIVTYQYSREALFNEVFKAKVHQLIGKNLLYATSLPLRVSYLPRMVLSLRKKIKEIKPDIIVARSSFECIYLYLATLFTPFTYVTHIHDTIAWTVGDVRQQALIYHKAFREIRESLPGHRQFIPKTPPKVNPVKRIIGEITSLVEYLAVRKAKKIFVLSNHVKWEVRKLYGKEAVVVRGGFDSQILSYQPRQNIKEKLGLSDKKMILNVNTLVPMKRVDLLIKAFNRLSRKFEDAVLVIGGAGPEEKKLQSLARQLGIEDKVRFIGYIPEGELWDYYGGCDIFVHPSWLTSAIAPFEALALGKKVIWSTDTEVDEPLRDNRHIFVANPTVDDLAETMERALTTEIMEKSDLSNYTWDRYCQRILTELEPFFSEK